ncbi:[LysW]-aminoadipate kinase [Melioribacteraceae bacterium 4301-Me]|uniref:[LysW]-aminoadipate kinase n=1 Tax=Pyranulibacter aquaticus TaxID=3163344 RepID=UPI00359B01A3
MVIIKIGGGKDINLKSIIADLKSINDKLIIVHGANALRDELADKLKIERKVITSQSGYTSVFSDEQTIDLMMMSYSGIKNKRIVELCQQNGINAVGLSGLDGKVIQGKRNSGIRVREAGKTKIVRDFSGKPQDININLINLLLNNGYTPVLCVPIIDENNMAINSENDDIVALLHSRLKADKILQLIEAPGYLKDKSDPNSLIKKISRDELEKIENEVDGRMKRKIYALRKLFEFGETTVIISDGRIENPIQNALKENGTVIK